MVNKALIAKLANKELTRRKIPPIDVLQECLPHQLEFIKNPHNKKVVCGTRRSAKSFMFALYLINQALTIDKSKCIYMGLTNESCKQIMYSSILEVIFDKYQIKAECNSKYEINFGNGSVIYLRGLDATPKQMSRLRGNKYDIAVMDELQDFTQDIEDIIDGVLKMTLAQTGATLCLGGTPSSNQGMHYFWRVCRPNSDLTQWQCYRFDWRQNTSIEPKTGKRVCDAIQEEIDKDIKNNPLIIETDRFKQEVLGQWVIDSEKTVYKLKDYNLIEALPANITKNATYILSIDLGYYDATTFVIGLYNKTFDNNLYIIESIGHSGLTVSAVANLIKTYKKKYNFTFHVVDAANAQMVEEMRQIHHLPLIAASKLGKESHIALANSDLITNNIKIIKSTNEELIKEMKSLIWDQKALLNGKHIENQQANNNFLDSFLYCHNFSRHYWFKSKPEQLPQDEEIVNQIEKQFGIKSKSKFLKQPWWNEEI